MPDVVLKDIAGSEWTYSDIDTVSLKTTDGGVASYVSQHLIQNQVQADWNQTDKTAVDFIKNKPETFESKTELPEVSVNDNGKVLGVINGAWAKMNISSGGGGGVSSWNDLTDKPFYTETQLQILLPEFSLPFALENGLSSFFTTPTTEMIELYQGEWSKAIITWDGIQYECEPKKLYGIGKAIGNVEFLQNVGDSGEPFVILLDADGILFGSPIAAVVSIEDTKNAVTSSTHSIGISLYTEKVYPLDSKFIDKVPWSKINNKPFEEFAAESVIVDEDIVLQSSNVPTPLSIAWNKIINGVQYIVTINDTAYTTYGIEEGVVKGLIIEDPETYQDIFSLISIYDGFISETLTVGETYHITITFAENYIKPLENKYLGIVNYMPDTILIPEQSLNFTADELGDLYTDIRGVSLIDSKKYQVIFDGSTYSYTATTNDNLTFLGDFNTVIIYNTEEGIRISVFDSSPSHTIALTELGLCEIKEEYLPSLLYAKIDQRIEDYINEALGGEY